jgi:hypothetical protein
MKVLLFITIKILRTCIYSNGAVNDGDYLIIVPRVFRAGTTQNISINIFGNKACDVRLTLDD